MVDSQSQLDDDDGRMSLIHLINVQTHLLLNNPVMLKCR